MTTYKIAPSILSADFANLQRDVEMINQSNADWFHVDVMDGVFVPNISLGLPVISAIKRHATKPLDVHLMIVQPERYISDFKKAGADVLTVHYEACIHLHRTIGAIKEADMLAGVALNPHTSVSYLQDILLDIDLVCLMSVNPGFGGQKFISKCLQKIKKLDEIREKKKLNFLIEVDGGINSETIQSVSRAGCDVFVAGSAIFGQDKDVKKNIKDLRSKL